MKKLTRFAALSAILTFSTQAKPLKVYVLVGQSNMEGHAQISTFDYIGNDPATAPLLKTMRDAQGKPTICQGAWISYLTGGEDENFTITGPLTAGYGSLWGQDRTKPGSKIGPEFTFGLAMDAAHDEPVLLIKCAWGGKSLHTDFRPPSAGPFEMSSFQLENYPKQEGHGIPKDLKQWKLDKIKATGHFYRLMVDHVNAVLADPAKAYPDYDAAQGYQLSGFIWLQGFNDMVDGHVYPAHNQPDQYHAYTDCLAHLIRDVRKEWKSPKLPVVIGVMGVGGRKDQSPSMTAFRNAMAAPADMPEFKGTVAAVQTAPFWSDELGAIDEKHGQIQQMRHYLNSKHKDYANADGTMTEEQKNAFMKKYEADLITPREVTLWQRGASNGGYHYLGCAKTFALMGQAFAKANLSMEPK